MNIEEINKFIRAELEIEEGRNIPEKLYEQDFKQSDKVEIVKEAECENMGVCFIVLKVIVENKEYFIEYDGYHDSWSGTSWDYEGDAFFVEPYQVTITEYKRIFK